MDPKIELYGLAVEAIERLREHDSDAADECVETLNNLLPRLFPERQVEPESLWKAYCLMSQAAASTMAVLGVARTSVDPSMEGEIAKAIDSAVVTFKRSETLAGLVALSPPAPDTPTP